MIFWLMTFVLALLNVTGIISISWWWVALPALFVSSIYGLLMMLGAIAFFMGIKTSTKR